MINAILTENGVLQVPGIPEYYLNNQDFRTLMNDKQLAAKVRNLFGRDVRIGVFGVLNEDNIYVEDTSDIKGAKEVAQCDERGLSFYAKLPDDISAFI